MKAEKRVGTYCMYCHNQIIGTDFIAVPTKGKGEKRYVCPSCAEMHNYNDKVDTLTGKETLSQMQVATEWEGHFYEDGIDVNGEHIDDRETIMAYLASQFHLLPTRDSTVGIECKEERHASLHGMKDRIFGISQAIDLTQYSSGQHINISKTTWDFNAGVRISDNASELFGKLADYLLQNEDECKQVFGRYFQDYCEYSKTTFSHGYWLNIRNSWHKNEACLEFRLAKFQNVDQYFYLLNFAKEIMIMVDKWLTDTENKYTTEKTSNNILKCFKKYVDGNALCMRPERNNANDR